MPRMARNAPGGLIYHVLNRAVARITLFRRDKDFEAFEATLAEARQRVPVPILAYCVMSNHWHLVLYPPRDGQLAEFMKWLTLTHAVRWRAAHQTIGYGPLYQGRYKAFAAQDDAHLYTLIRYVERNPLRASLVRRAEEWRWSSLWRRAHGSGAQRDLLSPWPLPEPSDWVERVNRPQTAAEEEALRASIYRSRPFGDPVWQEATARRLGLGSCFRPPGRPRASPPPAMKTGT